MNAPQNGKNSNMNQKIKKEIFRYLVAGLSAVATDLILYYLLLNIISYAPSKAVSFLGGTAVAFFINKYWTFEKKEKSLKEVIGFLCLYLSTLVINVLVNKLSIFIFPGWIFFAFLAATGTSTILNFIGQKWFIFKKHVSY